MPRKKRTLPPKKGGRPRRSLPFEEARSIILTERLSSSREYAKWWLFNRPVRIPKRPDRAYEKDWQGWNYFLGTHNVFPQKRITTRPFEEAKAFVRSLRLSTIEDWHLYIKSGNLPADIPRRPDFCYRESKKLERGGVWYSWSDWLGSKSTASQVEAIRSQILALLIVKPDQVPSNVYQFISVRGFDIDIRAKIKKEGLMLVRAYEMGDFDWIRYLKSTYQNYYGVEDHFSIANINDVFYSFDMKMKRYI
jgi:hypothetical protein